MTLLWVGLTGETLGYRKPVYLIMCSFLQLPNGTTVALWKVTIDFLLLNPRPCFGASLPLASLLPHILSCPLLEKHFFLLPGDCTAWVFLRPFQWLIHFFIGRSFPYVCGLLSVGKGQGSAVGSLCFPRVHSPLSRSSLSCPCRTGEEGPAALPDLHPASPSSPASPPLPILPPDTEGALS